VFAVQVVEHLTRDELAELFKLVAVKVKPGGHAAFETINPQSYTALARNFFRDPTHVWPLHPDTLSFVMEMQGLKTEKVLYRSPYPAEAMLQPLELSPYLPGRWHILLQQINDNVKRLNDLLFGHQDYCIVALIEGGRE
jgi:O-antigen chain-terminating methyltransferase